MENKNTEIEKSTEKEESPMFRFIKNMWIMRKATELFVEEQARRGRITNEEKEVILNTLRIGEK